MLTQFTRKQYFPIVHKHVWEYNTCTLEHTACERKFTSELHWKLTRYSLAENLLLNHNLIVFVTLLFSCTCVQQIVHVPVKVTWSSQRIHLPNLNVVSTGKGASLHISLVSQLTISI